MKCPVCQLDNPPESLMCKCGYNFNDSVKDFPNIVIDKGKALSNIRNAWIAGTISGIGTLIIVIISIVTGEIFLGQSIDGLVDVMIMLSLTFGIYKKSRVCAILMFVYFLFSKIMYIFVIQIFSAGSIVVSLIFLYFYFGGVRGTVNYHKLNKNWLQRIKGRLIIPKNIEIIGFVNSCYDNIDENIEFLGHKFKIMNVSVVEWV